MRAEKPGNSKGISVAEKIGPTGVGGARGIGWGTPAAAVLGFCGRSVFGREGRAKVAAAAAGIGGEVALERDQLRRARRIGGGQNRAGGETGVARAAEGDGGRGDAAGHRPDGEQGIEALEAFAYDGHPDHGERGVARDHAGQMRGAGGDGAQRDFGGPRGECRSDGRRRLPGVANVVMLHGLDPGRGRGGAGATAGDDGREFLGKGPEGFGEQFVEIAAQGVPRRGKIGGGAQGTVALAFLAVAPGFQRERPPESFAGGGERCRRSDRAEFEHRQAGAHAGFLLPQFILGERDAGGGGKHGRPGVLQLAKDAGVDEFVFQRDDVAVRGEW